MKVLGKLVLAGRVVFAVLQEVRPGIPEKPAAAEIEASPQVKQVLEKDCYSCHSDQRRLSWFDRVDQIVPGYWMAKGRS